MTAADDMRMGVSTIVVVLALAVTTASCGRDSANSGRASEQQASEQPQNKQADQPDLRGVWISPNTSLEDPRWKIEDRVCGRCALPALERLRVALDDPGSADRPLKEIMAEVNAFNKKYVSGLLTRTALAYQATYDDANDPVLACKPVGLFTQADGILPLQIEQYDDRVVFRYEYFNSVRTVYMDGRGHPADLKPSPLGHSIGWYDGETLVIDTIGLEPSLVGNFIVLGMRTSSLAQGIERYTRSKDTRSKDGNSLEREMTIIDPQTFRQPLIFKKAFLYAPKEKLQDFECDVRSAVTEDQHD